MIRTRLAALLAAGLLALPALPSTGSAVHAASGITGLWFNYDSAAPVAIADVEARCGIVAKTCLRPSYTVQVYGRDGATGGPLPAQQGTGGTLKVTLQPPCIHTLGSLVCAPTATSTSITLSPAGGNLRADIVTRNLLHPVLTTSRTETLCRCIPG
jgi:hypothetical protein